MKRRLRMFEFLFYLAEQSALERLAVELYLRPLVRRTRRQSLTPRSTWPEVLLVMALVSLSTVTSAYLIDRPQLMDLLRHNSQFALAYYSLLGGYALLWVQLGTGALYRLRHGLCR